MSRSGSLGGWSVSYLAWDGAAVLSGSPSQLHGGGVPPLARKPNYGFEKRKKEMDRKAKKDAKREDRQRRREEGQPEDSTVPPPQGDATAEP